MAPSDPGGCKVIMMIDTICMNTMRMKSERERERERESNDWVEWFLRLRRAASLVKRP